MTRHRRRRAGFTLIEVVISMVLLALIAGICYAAFHLGTQAGTKGEAAVETAKRLRVAMDVLIRQAKSMTPQGAAGDDGDRTSTYPFFQGSKAAPSYVEFVTEAGQLSGGGRARVRWEVENDPPRLRLTETPYFDAGTLGKAIDSEAPSVIVLDGFRSMAFDWCEHEPGDGGGESHGTASWNFQDRDDELLPCCIKAHIEGLFGADEDVNLKIPVMAAQCGAAENDSGPQEEQDCETDVGNDKEPPDQDQ
jgi:prepilin-type N-terminal cleavage/methylation domain-containing protein